MYQRKRYIFPGSIEVEEHHTGKYGAPGQPRVKRSKPTPEQIAKQNQKNRENKIRRLIKANFGPNDYWVTWTYRKGERPPDIVTAYAQAGKALRKLRRKYKKLGMSLKYIITTELGSRGGIHHHLVINRALDGDELIRDCWPYGGTNITLIYERGEYKELADYIAKRPEPVSENNKKGSKEQRSQSDSCCDKKYSHSKNLVMPEPEVKIMKRPTWGKEPKPPAGYYLDKNNYVEGVNPVTGFMYRTYIFIRFRRD